jgi:hypothetical protein
MGALKRILRAIFEDDGAPSLYSGLVVGARTPHRESANASAPAERRNAPESSNWRQRRP